MFEGYLSFCQRQPIASISVFITVVPIFAIWYRRAFIDPAFRLLFVYLILKLSIDLVMFHYASKRVNNILYYNIGVPIRYALLSGMFYYKMDKKIFKTGILISIGLFILFFIWDFLHVNPLLSDLHNHRMVLYASTLESLLMLFWVLLFFYQTIQALKIPNILTFPFFWVCSGLLLYYSTILFIAPVLSYTEKWNNKIDIGFLTYIPYIFESISMVLFGLGTWIFSARYYARK